MDTPPKRLAKTRWQSLADQAHRVEVAEQDLRDHIARRDQDIREWCGKGPGQLLVPEIAIATGLSQREVEEILGISDIVVTATTFS